MKNDFLNLDATGQAELVKKGEISAKELVEATIERIEEINPKINALAGTDFERALKIAETPTSGPFQGVPFLVKDVLSYPGLRYSVGSRLFAENIAAEGSPFTESLDNCGFITLGKTTCSEFGLLGSTETILEGNTFNPWNREYSAFGSSGGSAAAVASGMVPIAHASDAGGSIRSPASVNGLFGLKPSAYRTISTGVPENPFMAIAVDLCVSRSVRDTACFLSVVENREKNRVYDPVGFVKEPINRPLRIGMYSATLMGKAPEPDILKNLHDTASLCRDLNHDVVEIVLPGLDGQGISDAFFTVAGSVISQLAEMMEGMLGQPIDDKFLEPFTLSLIDWFRSQQKEVLEEAQTTFKESSRMMNELLSQYDVLLTPTLATEVPKLGELSPVLDREVLIRKTEEIVGFTPIHSICGATAMSVPLGMTSSGMPVGSHFAAPAGSEELLLKLAYQLEEAKPWFDRRPVI